MRLFAGDDWAHDHHDVEVMGETVSCDTHLGPAGWP